MFEMKDLLDEERMRRLGLGPGRSEASWMPCTDACVKLLSTEGEILYMSRNGLCAMEIPDLEMVRGKIWWELWPEGSRKIVRRSVEEALRGRIARFTADCPTAAGNPASWHVTVTGVPGPDGRVVELLSISRKLA